MQVLHWIENYDETGNPIAYQGATLLDHGDVSNDRIDGWTREDRNDPKSLAPHRTEAGRFQDFDKYGWETLKGASSRTADQIIKDNPLLANLSEKDKQALIDKFGDYTKDSKLALKLAHALTHIEKFNHSGHSVSGDKVGNGRIDGFDLENRDDPGSTAQSGTQAERFESFLKSDTPFEDLEGFEDPASKDAINPLTSDFIEDVYAKIVRDADLPENRQDLINHPEKYTAEQRYARQIEITLAMNNLTDGSSEYYNEDGTNSLKQPGDPDVLNSDAQKVVDDAQKIIEKLDSPEVREYAAQAPASGMQTMLQDNPGLRDRIQVDYDEMKTHTVGLEDFVGEGKDTLAGMQQYFQQIQVLNLALGKDGEPLENDVTIDILNTPQFDAVTDAHEKNFRDPATLNNLIADFEKQGISHEEAEKMGFAEFNNRLSLFSSFGSPATELTSVTNENINNYIVSTSTVKYLNDVPFIKEDGELDETALLEIIEQVQQADPQNGLFKTEDGGVLTPGQVVLAAKQAWDGIRNLGKINDKLGKLNIKEMFSKDGFYQKSLFASGAMHIVSAVFGAGIIAARLGYTRGKASPGEIAAIVGVGIQTLGVSVQGFEFTQRDNPKIGWGAKPPADPPPVEIPLSQVPPAGGQSAGGSGAGTPAGGQSAGGSSVYLTPAGGHPRAAPGRARLRAVIRRDLRPSPAFLLRRDPRT